MTDNDTNNPRSRMEVEGGRMVIEIGGQHIIRVRFIPTAKLEEMTVEELEQVAQRMQERAESDRLFRSCWLLAAHQLLLRADELRRQRGEFIPWLRRYPFERCSKAAATA